MNDLREAAQQVLEACEQRLPLVGQATIIDELNALRAALAQEQAGPVKPGVWMHPWPPVRAQQAEPVQEPAAKCIDDICSEHLGRVEAFDHLPRGTLFYATPPQRTMVPLTDEEIVEAVREADLDWQAGWTLDEHAPNRFDALARAVEKASWEKNK